MPSEVRLTRLFHSVSVSRPGTGVVAVGQTGSVQVVVPSRITAPPG